MRPGDVVGAIVLNAKAALGTTVNKAMGIDRIDQLLNPSRTPILVDEIRFRLDPADPDTLMYPGIGAAVRCRLDLGRMQLTAGRFIPIAALCSSLDLMAEAAGSVGLDALAALPSTSMNHGEFIWRLPRPLYVPGGELIVPQFYLDGDLWAGHAGFTAYITFIGRALSSDAPIPKYVNVPFATAWIDSLRAGQVDALAVRSIRSDLKNPFAEDLFVQKMIGTFGYISDAAGATTPLMMGDGLVDPTYQIFGGANACDSIGNDAVKTRIFKSNGFQVAKDMTPWAHLFPWTTRTLDLCGVLHRNEWYQLQTDLKLLTDVSMSALDSIKLMASLIGYRKVAYARGSGFVEAM